MDTGTYLLTLLVTFDQEYAIQRLFTRHGWKYDKKDDSSDTKPPSNLRENLATDATIADVSTESLEGTVKVDRDDSLEENKELQYSIKENTETMDNVKVDRDDSLEENQELQYSIKKNTETMDNDYDADTDDGGAADMESDTCNTEGVSNVNNVEIKQETCDNKQTRKPVNSQLLTSIPRKTSKRLRSATTPLRLCSPRKQTRTISPVKASAGFSQSENNHNLLDGVIVKIEQTEQSEIDRLLMELETMEGIEHYSKLMTTKSNVSSMLPPGDMDEYGHSVTLSAYFCSDCGYIFPEMEMYSGHRRAGKCVFPCEFCGEVYSFRNYSKYEEHVKTHSFQMLDTTFQEGLICSECGKYYRTKGGLRKHMMAHTGSQPYQCCGKKFIEKSQLLAHNMTHHSKNKITCDICGTKFTTKSALKRHGSIHSSSSAIFQCQLCTVSFRRKDMLADHIRGIHNREKRYSCHTCSKHYWCRSSLRRHLMNNHK